MASDRSRNLALGTLLAGLAAWLWPIGLGGRMPVGGDVTQFAIGLMAVYRHALRAGHLPLWNDLWGYGFPGLVESQMGVYYPPHLALYGLLPAEVAYSTSLVLHTSWGGLGAYWTGRRFEASAAGAALGAFAWSASGLFVIHLPHHWAATTAAWMPWVWGLAWPLVRGTDRSARDALLLAAVLTLQVLPGHFQFAFVIQLGVLGLALLGLGIRKAMMGGTGLVVAVVAAALAGGHAAPTDVPPGPARGLPARLRIPVPFRRNASPPGQLRRAGAVPPLAALAAGGVGPVPHIAGGATGLYRADAAIPRTRGPPAGLAVRSGDPGARLAGRGEPPAEPGTVPAGVPRADAWPGFSFFRAPARWGLATEMALALLAPGGSTPCGRGPGRGRPGGWPGSRRAWSRSWSWQCSCSSWRS